VRPSLSTILTFEAAIALAFLLLAMALPALRFELLYVAAMTALFFVLHLPLARLRGPSFVIRDEPPDSPLKYYWFGSIAAAAFAGGYLRDALLRVFV
jgi:hypothetical protein